MSGVSPGSRDRERILVSLFTLPARRSTHALDERALEMILLGSETMDMPLEWITTRWKLSVCRSEGACTRVPNHCSRGWYLVITRRWLLYSLRALFIQSPFELTMPPWRVTIDYVFWRDTPSKWHELFQDRMFLSGIKKIVGIIF